MSYPLPPIITPISAGQTAVSSVGVLDTNYDAIAAAIAAANAAMVSFYLAWAPAGGIIVASASPVNLPIAGMGLTIQLVPGSVWVINGFTITIGNSPAIITGIPDNASNYIYLDLDASGNPIFYAAHSTSTPSVGHPCAGIVTATGGQATGIDTTKTNTIPTLAYMLTLGGGGGGGSFDPSAIWDSIAALQASIVALQNTQSTTSATASSLLPDSLLDNDMVIMDALTSIDPAAANAFSGAIYKPGLTGGGELLPDGSSAPDVVSGGDAVADNLSHTVS